MRKPWVLVVVAVVAFFAWRWMRSPSADVADDGGVRVQQRIWIDHVPSNDRDPINAFILIEDERVGVFQKASAWRGAFEIFRWSGRSDELTLLYPQTGDRETVHARARKCNATGMDFCLELAGNSRGVSRYYSRKGWEIRANDAADAERDLDAVLGQLGDTGAKF